ncbi:high mobility group box domain-containing protein, partial [Mycena galericulata]
PSRIRRPKNAFIIFRSAYVRRTQEKLGQTELSRAAADVWKNMSDAQQMPYKLLANREKLEHAAKHPDYRYNPVRKPKNNLLPECRSEPSTRER